MRPPWLRILKVKCHIWPTASVLLALLAASNMTFEDVVKFTVYVTDKSILDDYFCIRERIMGDHNPPATLLVVNKFPRSGVEVEIETIAAKAD